MTQEVHRNFWWSWDDEVPKSRYVQAGPACTLDGQYRRYYMGFRLSGKV